MSLLVTSLSRDKNKHLFVSLVVSFLFAGVAFRLLFLGSSDVADTEILVQPAFTVDLSQTRDHAPEVGNEANPLAIEPGEAQNWDENSNPVNSHLQDNAQVPVKSDSTAIDSFQENRDQIPKKDKCDIFAGDWVPNPDGPRYTNDTCTFITSHQNCVTNGRPDTRYMYWKWNPTDCEVPPFDAETFLQSMRNKTWALIGDSISRNHADSMLCLLSKVEQAVEVYHDEKWQSRRWTFPTYNFTLSTLWSPFLATAAIFEDSNGVSSSEAQLHIDKLDPTWTNLYQGFDYMMINTGKWYSKTIIYYENSTILGCHNCTSARNHTKMGMEFGYRKVLQKVFDFILESNHPGTIFYRTSTPEHFENGDWYEGGSCKRTEPVKEGEFRMINRTRVLRVVELDEFDKAAAKASEKGVDLRLFDVMQLSLQRPDGHPDVYRWFHPDNSTRIVSDCLHWCLPGPIDTWGDLLMEMIVNG